MTRVLHWNGKDVPEELRDLPPGRYVLESVDDVVELTEEQEEGLRAAMSTLREGRGRTLDEVRKRFTSRAHEP